MSADQNPALSEREICICPFCGLVAPRLEPNLCRHPGAYMMGLRKGSRTPRVMVPYHGPKVEGWDTDWLERVKPIIYVRAKEDAIERGVWRG